MHSNAERRIVLLAGPTASGKSALALQLARQLDGVIVNADALQVYDRWPCLTAQPTATDHTEAQHRLYGHVDYRESYSVGRWIRDVTRELETCRSLIIVGGTGLYLTRLTTGLAPIPAIPDEIRRQGDAHRLSGNLGVFHERLERDDPVLWVRIDRANGMRLQRAWEVLVATGKPLSEWQSETPPPLVSLKTAQAYCLMPQVAWLDMRISRRFDEMVSTGALDEARQMLPDWDPELLSSKALGAAELIGHLKGELSLEEAIDRAKLATRQFAKRQRTWFRSNMKDWTQVPWDGSQVQEIVDDV